MNETTEELVRLLKERAENLYLTRQFRCAESVMAALNRGLGGGIPTSLAVRLASGFPGGLGDCGCSCGALTGGVMALGLFLTRECLTVEDQERVTAAAKLLHDAFKHKFRSTCCRVLSKNDKPESEEQLARCAIQTGAAAELAAEIILEHRPELLYSADWEYLSRNDSMVTAGLKQLAVL